MTPSNASSACEPGLGLALLPREGRQRDARVVARKQPLQSSSALDERLFEKGPARPLQQAIKGDEGRRRLVRQPPDAALGRMQAQLQGIE
jgi:hypothetical protein